MKRALLVIAQRNYQDLELSGTRDVLLEAGFTVEFASSEAGACHGKFGGIEQADFALRDVVVKEYDCIAFIGGPGAAVFASDPEALRIANEAAHAEIPLGAICIAPVILAKARVLEGRRATAWDDDGKQSALLTQYGATFTGDSVVVDGNIATGNGPDAAEEFGRALVRIAR
ncbi:MAG: DJ-1/PfpI family protein [Candidatus Peribacteraceae bacterium]|nr:DJ-1/PfpI family protein [Candidatus Peribacteraceae bacterium]